MPGATADETAVDHAFTQWHAEVGKQLAARRDRAASHVERLAAKASSRAREGGGIPVHVVCRRCRRRLDSARLTITGEPVRLSKGEPAAADGSRRRVAYNCRCGAHHVVNTMRLVQAARAAAVDSGRVEIAL